MLGEDAAGLLALAGILGMLAVQQETFNGYATGAVSSAAEALDYSAAKQQEILFNAGRTTVAPPEGTAGRTLQ